MTLRSKTALGIDIGERHVSMALVEKGTQGVRIIAAAGAAVPPSEAGKQKSAHGRMLSRLLAQLGRRSRVRHAQAAVALSADSVVLHLLDMPRHVPTNIGEFVRSELQQYVALSGKSVISDFCGAGPGRQKRVLAVAADGDEIRETVAACSEAGVAVDLVEPSALAYARAFSWYRKEAWHNGNGLIALLGWRTLTVLLFRRGTLDFVRVRHVSQEADTLPRLCAWLAEELKAVTRYDDTQTPQRGGDRRTCVIIHDGPYTAGDLAPLLTDAAPAESFTVVGACEPLPDSPAAPGGGASLVAVGAALSLLETAENGPKVNLLPETVTRARSLARHVLATALVSVVLFLGVFATAGLLARATRAMDRKIEQTRLAGEFYATPALMAEEKFLDREIAGLRHRLDPLHKALAGRHETDWPGILAAVRQAIPSNVSIRQLQCTDARTVSLKGFTPSCPAAETFVRNLERQRLFAVISLTSLQRQQGTGGRLEYRIDCLLKTEGGKSS